MGTGQQEPVSSGYRFPEETPAVRNRREGQWLSQEKNTESQGHWQLLRLPRGRTVFFTLWTSEPNRAGHSLALLPTRGVTIGKWPLESASSLGRKNHTVAPLPVLSAPGQDAVGSWTGCCPVFPSLLFVCRQGHWCLKWLGDSHAVRASLVTGLAQVPTLVATRFFPLSQETSMFIYSRVYSFP